MRPILIWFSAIRAKSGFVECVNAKAITTSNIGEQFSALEIWFKMFPAGFKDYKKIKTFYSSHYLLKKNKQIIYLLISETIVDGETDVSYEWGFIQLRCQFLR